MSDASRPPPPRPPPPGRGPLAGGPPPRPLSEEGPADSGIQLGSSESSGPLPPPRLPPPPRPGLSSDPSQSVPTAGASLGPPRPGPPGPPRPMRRPSTVGASIQPDDAPPRPSRRPSLMGNQIDPSGGTTPRPAVPPRPPPAPRGIPGQGPPRPPPRPLGARPPPPRPAALLQTSSSENTVTLTVTNLPSEESSEPPADARVIDEEFDKDAIKSEMVLSGTQIPPSPLIADPTENANHDRAPFNENGKIESGESDTKSRRSVKFNDFEEVALINNIAAESGSSALSAVSSSVSSPTNLFPSSSADGSNSLTHSISSYKPFDGESESSLQKKKVGLSHSPTSSTVSRELYENLQSELQAAQEQIIAHVKVMAGVMKAYRHELEQSNIDALVDLIRKPLSTAAPSASLSSFNSTSVPATPNPVSVATSTPSTAVPQVAAEQENLSFEKIDQPDISLKAAMNPPSENVSGASSLASSEPKVRQEKKQISANEDNFITHDATWKELALVEEKKMTWGDLREALQLRNTVLRAALGSGRSRKQQEDILQKVDKELSQPKKIKDLTNLDSASKMLEEYFQHGEYLLLYRIAAYDEILNKALVKFPCQIQEALQEVVGQFEQLRRQQVHHNVRTLYKQEVQLIQTLWEKKREQIMQQEQLKAALLAETLEWGLQKEEDLYERYLHHENLDKIRSQYLDQVDEVLTQTYDKIFQRLRTESPTKGISLEKMYDQLNAIRRGTLVWKQQYSRRLEDRLHNIELVIDGYYMSFTEDLVEQLQELHKANTISTCYAEQLTSHLTSLAIKLLDGGLKRPEQDALNSFKSFHMDPKSRKPILRLGSSIRSLAAMADIPHDDTARVLTGLLFTTTKDREKDPSIPRNRQAMFG